MNENLNAVALRKNGVSPRASPSKHTRGLRIPLQAFERAGCVIMSSVVAVKTAVSGRGASVSNGTQEDHVILPHLLSGTVTLNSVKSPGDPAK